MSNERDDAPSERNVRRHHNGIPEGDREAKRRTYMADLSTRLRHACRHLSDAEFARLVFDIAEMKLRFAAIEAAAWPHRVVDAPSA